MNELVVLVDEQDRPIGATDKRLVHTTDTPLHRGFSLFIFNSKKQLLITQRSFTKATFPGLWTNTVCGHPAPGETIEAAAKRRLKQELNLIIFHPKLVSTYRYRFADINGVVENEICPILIAKCDAYPRPNTQEVTSYKWVAWSVFLEEIQHFPQNYSPWVIEEAELVDKFLKQTPL